MLPLQTLDLIGVDFGSAVFLIGLLAIVAWIAIQASNIPAMMLWLMTVLLLIFAGILGIPVELFWLGLVFTVILLLIGFAINWRI